MDRLQWTVPDRAGWVIEVGRLPERKNPYAVLSTSDDMISLARFLDDRAAATFAEILDAFATRDQRPDIDTNTGGSS